MSEPIKNRYEFVVLFDVENGNPNGDPDAGNMPRVDPETGYGLVTDVCLKRKIRNYVEMAKEGENGYRIYIKDGVPLNTSDKEACAYVRVDPDKLKDAKKKDEHLDEKLRDFMCDNFYDIRTFGAVMTTFVKGALNCGQVRGPVQLGFARSVDPILPQEVTITRVAITTEADAEKKGTEMGRKYIVPYGLYRAEGYVSANLARKTTGFSQEDLDLLWTAILNMFENDHSAARGKMAVRELIVFKHDCELGCAPAHKLFELVKAVRKDGVTTPRSYEDYTVTVDEEKLPEGVPCGGRSPAKLPHRPEYDFRKGLQCPMERGAYPAGSCSACRWSAVFRRIPTAARTAAANRGGDLSGQSAGVGGHWRGGVFQRIGRDDLAGKGNLFLSRAQPPSATGHL